MRTGWSGQGRFGASSEPTTQCPPESTDEWYYGTCDCIDYMRGCERGGMSEHDFGRRVAKLDMITIATQSDDDAHTYLHEEHRIILNDTQFAQDPKFLIWRLHGDKFRWNFLTKTSKSYKDPDRAPKVSFHLVMITVGACDPTDWACKHILLAGLQLVQTLDKSVFEPRWLPVVGRSPIPVPVALNATVGYEEVT